MADAAVQASDLVRAVLRATNTHEAEAPIAAALAQAHAEGRAEALEALRAALGAFQKWSGYSQPWRKVRERVEYRSPVCEIAADGDLPVVLDDVPPLLADFIIAAYNLAAGVAGQPSGDAKGK